MWNNILEQFDKYPSQQKVLRKILELGLRVDENKKLYCNDVEINMSSLAKTINTDRRVVVSTIEHILNDEELRSIFLNLHSAGPLLTNISSKLNLGVIEIEGDSQKPGILSSVSEMLAMEGISIRQAYVSDPEIDPIPHMTIITNDTVEGSIIQLLLQIDGVSKVSIY